MINQPTSAVNFRFLLPETLWLEPEHFEQAKHFSKPFKDEKQQWQAHLNALALLAFEGWLKERLPDAPIQHISNESVAISYLKVGAFKLGLLAIEHVLDEVVDVPRVAIEQPALAAHFYVVMEVLEDQAQVIVRGFVRYDELTASAHRITSSPPDEFCLLPLSTFDAELNHLIVYLQYTEPSTIPLPTTAAIKTASPNALGTSRVRLSQWLQGVLDEGWQTIDALVNPEANLAWSTRQTNIGAKGGKLINFGMQLGCQAVALLVTVMPDSEEKIGIGIQVLPAAGAQFLPTQLQLTLLSSTDKILQEVQSRGHDNYIQLKSFKGKPGISFSIEVSLNDIRVREPFEL